MNGTWHTVNGHPNHGGRGAGLKTLFWCPDDKRPDGVMGISYHMNAVPTNIGNVHYSASGYNFLKLTRAATPQQTMYILDGWRNNYQGAWYYIQPYTMMHEIDYRHMSKTNALHLAGHVEAYVSARITPNSHSPFWGWQDD